MYFWLFRCCSLFFSLLEQCDLFIEASRDVMHVHPYYAIHDFDSNALCDLHSYMYGCMLWEAALWLRCVEIATNRRGDRVHAGEVLKRYTPDKNQAAPTRYQISEHNFNLDILHTDCSVFGTRIRSWLERGFR